MDRIAEPDKRAAPAPQEEQAYSPGPVLLGNEYQGGDEGFQTLLEWHLPKGSHGRLHELKLTSSNDAKTRWRINLNGREMKLPSDRTVLITPATYSWFGAEVVGQAVLVELMSIDGTTITATAVITGEVS